MWFFLKESFRRSLSATHTPRLPWRDFNLLVFGVCPVLQLLAKLFCLRWRNSNAQPLFFALYLDIVLYLYLCIYFFISSEAGHKPGTHPGIPPNIFSPPWDDFFLANNVYFPGSLNIFVPIYTNYIMFGLKTKGKISNYTFLEQKFHPLWVLMVFTMDAMCVAAKNLTQKIAKNFAKYPLKCISPLSGLRPTE